MTGALWPHTQPSAAMLAAYEADPALAALRLDFTATVHELLQVTIAGLLARSTCCTGRADAPYNVPLTVERFDARTGKRPERRRPGARGLVGLDPGAGSVDAFGERVDAERGALGVWQPVDGQAAGDVVDRGPHPGDLRVVGVPVGHEDQVKSGADEIGERHLVLQAQGQGDRIGAESGRRRWCRACPNG